MREGGGGPARMATRGGEEGGPVDRWGERWSAQRGSTHGEEHKGGVHMGRPGEKGDRPSPGEIVTFQNYSKIFIFELN
jgi:hypothetical protein